MSKYPYKITSDRKAELVSLMEVEPAIAIWQLAERLGKHENTVRRWMRNPNDEQMSAITGAIKEVRQAQH